MTEAESPRHLFNFFNNRVIDLNRCKGAVYDFACGLHRYTLNREPTQYEDKYFLVDGSHWTSTPKFQTKSKKQAGHLGCSSGYNFNAYKPYSDAISAKNSQGREQMHSVLDKLFYQWTNSQNHYVKEIITIGSGILKHFLSSVI